MKLALVGIPVPQPPHPASPKILKVLQPRHRSTAPSPSCRPPAPPRLPQPQPPQPPYPQVAQESMWDDSSEVYAPLPANWVWYATAFATLAGALALSDAELRALLLVPRTLRSQAQAAAPSLSEDERERPATRSQAGLGRKVEFALRGSRKQYLRKYGVPMYALLGASEGALMEHVVGGGTRVMVGVSLRRVRIRFIWPRPPASSAPSVMYDEWVCVDESTTKVRLAMLIARVFNGFVEQQKIGELSRDQTFKWRLRPDTLYRTWLVRLERVETNVFVADVRYALHDP